MTTLLVLMTLALAIASGALLLTLINLRVYCGTPVTARQPTPPESAPPPAAPPSLPLPPLFVCIPARNEEHNLEDCVRSLLQSDYPDLRILVYNDASTDSTADILDRLRTADNRVTAVPTAALPEGWNGKQWGCEQMGQFALRSIAPNSQPNSQPNPQAVPPAPPLPDPFLLFTDADVRFERNALTAAASRAGELKADLLSTFPRQITGSLAEILAVPMIHFILFSYLPMPRMRTTNDPASSAGCGQFLLVRARSWSTAGGHAAFKDSMHDGIKLPRNVRKAGLHTDLFDGTDLCRVRMYTGLAQTWRGFTKNAYEGLGSPFLLVFITLIHLLGHIAPPFILIWAALRSADAPSARLAIIGALAGLAWICTVIQRGILAQRFKQPPAGILLHPFAVAFITIIQWHSFFLHLRGKRSWKGR